ncbi:glycosyltransferase family 2 protein [Anaerolineales bacterium HSG6]|nr:glycosyltransferase family 2 protein [Anaerolineales bacterium HSG6]MDM8530361.1 glycosyltransferase family 2 protein [Anaerolineales bacterium HSG25]
MSKFFPQSDQSWLVVVIVSWNVQDMLTNCLRSLETEITRSGIPTQVWLIDNASSDDTVTMVKRDFPTVKLIASPQNLGFAGGNNAVLRAIGFDDPASSPQNLPQGVLLLNPDTELHADSLTQLWRFLEDTPQAGIVGAKLVYGDGSFQHGAFALPGLWQLTIELPPLPDRFPLPGRIFESRLNGRYPRRWYEEQRPFLIGHPLGAVMLVRGAAIQQVGLLDEQYHMYVEEVDWSKRITAAGWRAYCVPAATVTHFGGQSTEQIKTDSFINLWRSRYRFYRKYYGWARQSIATWLVQTSMKHQQKRVLTEFKSQQISQDEFVKRLIAYQTVLKIWQGRVL